MLVLVNLCFTPALDQTVLPDMTHFMMRALDKMPFQADGRGEAKIASDALVGWCFGMIVRHTWPPLFRECNEQHDDHCDS